MIVLSNDPSVAAWGWAIIKIHKGMARIMETGCIKTETQYKAGKIYKADDNARRFTEIVEVLNGLHKKYKIDWILTEAPHGSQSASAAIMVGAVAGILATFSVCHGLPVDYYNEKEAKRHLLGSSSGSKQATIDGISAKYGTKWVRNVKYIDEAVADALQIFDLGRTRSQALMFAQNQK